MTVIDVRTPEEFSGGHVARSINIPLLELPKRLKEVQNLTTPLILCCASGSRSGQAEAFLKASGVACENGGSWLEVNSKL